VLHPQLRNGGFWWSKVLMPAGPCWRQLAHSHYREDARVLNSPVFSIYKWLQWPLDIISGSHTTTVQKHTILMSEAHVYQASLQIRCFCFHLFTSCRPHVGLYLYLSSTSLPQLIVFPGLHTCTHTHTHTHTLPTSLKHSQHCFKAITETRALT